MFSGAECLDWVHRWREFDYPDSLDRSRLSFHFDGGSLDSDSDDDGVVGRINYLTGHKHLHKVFSELFGIFSRGKGFFDFEVMGDQNESRRRYVQSCLNSVVNMAVKDSKRLRYPYWAVCGDSVLNGAPFLVRTDPYDWCPQYVGKPWMPRNAPADIFSDEFLMWAFAGELGVRDLKAAGARQQRGEGTGRWKMGAISDLLSALSKRLTPHVTPPVKGQETPEQMEYDYQSNAWPSSILSNAIPVYWFFHKDLDNEGAIDCYCIHREGEMENADEDHVKLRLGRDESAKWEHLLYYEKARFDGVEDCLFPFLLDCSLGGQPRMHRILGLGKLLYDADRAEQELLNTLVAGVREDFRPIWQAATGVSMAKLSMLLKEGLGRSSVLPAEILPVDRPRSRNYAHAEALVDRMEGIQGRNSSTFVGQSTGSGSRELEIEALARQAEASRVTNNRMSAWLETGDCLVAMMANTLLKTPLAKGDRAYGLAKEIRQKLRDKGIEAKDYKDCVARMQRLPGGGDNALALNRALGKMKVLGQLPPEAQRVVVKDYIVAIDEDPRSGEYLLPEAPKPDVGQLLAIQLQNASAMATGVPPLPLETDIPAIHAPAHLAIVQAQLEIGQLDASQSNGVAALLEHTMADIRLLAGYDLPLAKQLEQRVQQFAAAAEQMRQEQTPPAQPDEHKMMIAERQQALAEQKLEFSQGKFEVTQGDRRQKEETATILKFEAASLADDKARIDAAYRAEELKLKREALERQKTQKTAG